MLVELDRDRIVCRVSFHEKDALKLVPGARWNMQSHPDAWSVPLSWAACKQLRGVFGDRLEIGPALHNWAWNEMNVRVNPSLAWRVAQDGEGDADDYPFQRAGEWFLVVARRALLADDMGTGKTRQTVKALVKLDKFNENPWPALIVCPNSIKHLAWERELRMHLPLGCEIIVLEGGAAKREKSLARAKELAESGLPVVVIINWESVRLHSRLAPYGSVNLQTCSNCDAESQKRPATCHRCPKELNRIAWRTVIADEVHRAIDPKAQQTRAVWAVAHQPTVEFRYALTGTPIASNVGDAWSIFHFIDPIEWPAKSKMLDRYGLLSWNAFGGLEIVGINPANSAEYFSIIDPRMRRMPKEVVLPFLPPKVPQVREVEMSAKQAKAYKQMTETMLAQLDMIEDERTMDVLGGGNGTQLITAPNPLTQMTRLLQFSSAYAEVEPDGQVKITEPSCKIDELEEITKELGDEPFVVAAESRQLIELACARLDKLGIKWSRIVGGMTDEQRTQAVDDFQQGRVRACLFTIKAGGVGLTLTRAGYIIFLQRSWSMIENRQAVDRCHRIGSEAHDKIVVIDIVARGTVEEQQIEAILEKSERLEEFVRDRETLRKLLKG